jgi:hypothetical protein
VLGASVGFAVAPASVVLGSALSRAATTRRYRIQAALAAAESLNALTPPLNRAQLAKALAEAIAVAVCLVRPLDMHASEWFPPPLHPDQAAAIHRHVVASPN